MRLTIPGGPRKPAVRPDRVGLGRLRHIGIIGGAPDSIRYAPWGNPSWEFWTHSSAVLAIPYLRCDRIFDTHPPHCFMEARKNGFKDYYAFLQTCPTPIYMQQQYAAIPQSRRYPYEVLKMLWPGVPFGSQAAYMIALALYEGVTHLGFFGVDYAHETEYQQQRSNAEQWVGIARGLGVHIILPPKTPFCQEPREDYAYQSHSTPEKYEAIKAKFAAAKAGKASTLPFQPTKLVPVQTPEAVAAATVVRMATQPAWVKETASFRDDPRPAWLEEEAAAQRGADHAARRKRAKEIKDALRPVDDLAGAGADPTVPRDRPQPEGAPRPPAMAPTAVVATDPGLAAARAFLLAQGAGVASPSGDGDLQPGRDPVSPGMAELGSAAADDQPRRRAAVAGVRRPTRPRAPAAAARGEAKRAAAPDRTILDRGGRRPPPARRRSRR
jgi:hypothetical protein